MTDVEIWQTANLMIKRYGDNAAFEAELMVDALLDEGEVEGERAWRYVLKTIELLRGQIGIGETKH